MLNFWVFFCSFFCLMGSFTVLGNVVLIGSNVTLSFEDTEANFAPLVKGSGKCGTLYVAEPLDACSPLTNKIVSKLNDTIAPFVLIIRGGCSFEEKVRRAQAAGFRAAIVYDSENDDLVAMAGHAAGIKILAVFVTKASGETLKKYAGAADVELWIVPSFVNSAWSIMGISFISLLAMCAVVVSCFFVRRNRIRRGRPRTPRVCDFHGMSSRLVKAMPSLIFTTVLDDNCTSRTCTICLEDYDVGEKLRILPCHHKFHAVCVDTWLTSWRTFCPVCKRDARTNTSHPPSSESTPLLSSNPDSVSSLLLSSFRSSISSSSAIQTHSISSSSNNQQSLQSHNQSPHPRANRGIIDLKNASSQRSPSASLVSPHSSLSHLNSRQISSCIPTQCNASSSHIGSSSCQPNPLQYSESAENFLPISATQSLSEC